jgi:hypothetical protein
VKSDKVLITAIIALLAIAIVRTILVPTDNNLIYVVVGIIGAIVGVSGTMVAPKVKAMVLRKMHRCL